MQISPINSNGNNKFAYNQNFAGKVSPEIFQHYYKNNFHGLDYGPMVESLSKIINKTTSPNFEVTLNKTNVVYGLSDVTFLPKKSMRHPYSLKDVTHHFELANLSPKGIEYNLFEHYAKFAELLPFQKKLNPEEILALKKDCATILKVQRQQKIGYEKYKKIPFSWSRIKRNLIINGQNPNPTLEDVNRYKASIVSKKYPFEINMDKLSTSKSQTSPKPSTQTSTNVPRKPIPTRKIPPKTSIWDKIKNFFGG